jgi:hypothetical protein
VDAAKVDAFVAKPLVVVGFFGEVSEPFCPHRSFGVSLHLLVTERCISTLEIPCSWLPYRFHGYG